MFIQEGLVPLWNWSAILFIDLQEVTSGCYFQISTFGNPIDLLFFFWIAHDLRNGILLQKKILYSLRNIMPVLSPNFRPARLWSVHHASIIIVIEFVFLKSYMVHWSESCWAKLSNGLALGLNLLYMSLLFLQFVLNRSRDGLCFFFPGGKSRVPLTRWKQIASRDVNQ